MCPAILLLFILLSACTLKPASSIDEVELTVIVNSPVPASSTFTPAPLASHTATGTAQPSSNVQTSATVSSACTPRTNMVSYTVVSGDSLSSIAARTGSTVAELVEWNCLANANMIVVGMRLQVEREAIPATLTPTPSPTATQTFTPSPASLPLVTGPMGALAADPATQNAPNWTEYLVNPGTAVTIVWSGIDPEYYAHVGQIEFFYTADGSSPVSIGIDTDKSDGMSITWLIPTGISGRITARARYGMSGSIDSPAIFLRPQ